MDGFWRDERWRAFGGDDVMGHDLDLIYDIHIGVLWVCIDMVFWGIAYRGGIIADELAWSSSPVPLYFSFILHRVLLPYTYTSIVCCVNVEI
jgi:hypothetical protein